MKSAYFPVDCPVKETGFTIIEVLVAVTILAVGMLALASVQASGIRSTNMAYQRTQASMAAMDIADRMRANKAGVDNGSYNNIASPAGLPPITCVGTATNCTATQVANRDAYDWLTSLANRDLLNPDGAVTCLGACGPGSTFQITVRWDSRRNGAAGLGCNPANPADKICYQVVVQP